MSKPDIAALEQEIETAFDNREKVDIKTQGAVREAVEAALELLDSGKARVAERGADGNWTVNQWLKKAVLLSFRLNPMEVIKGGPGEAAWWDKVPSKFEGWSAMEFESGGFRAVPNAVVRRSAHIGKGVVLMPSFVNLGAYVGRGHDGRQLGDRRLLRADRQERASFGRRRHRRRARADAGRADDHRGQLLHRRALGSGGGLHRARGLGARHGRLHRQVDQDRQPGDRRVSYGEVPPYSVVVAGSMPGKPMGNGEPGPSLYCAVIVKTVDERTRSKTGINELLRD